MVSAAPLLALAATVVLYAYPIKGDIYLHNPRGSNGRGCRHSNGKARSGNEAQRLFDSQNNDNGGYSCPNSYPFPCYLILDETARAACNAKNNDPTMTEEAKKAAVREDGSLTHPDAIVAPRMYYFVGSELSIEWTAQHGSGENSKLNSDIIIQVGCEGEKPDSFSFTDDCGVDNGGKTCLPRDGQPIHNQDDVNTQRIEDAPGAQDDYRYGRHESFRYYQRCKKTERNKGLFVADQTLQGSAATATRQNPNNARNGFECPEESEYYPYWAPTPWIDIAIVTSNLEKCEEQRERSQNVIDKEYCECDADACQNRGTLPNNRRACVEKGGKWLAYESWTKRFERLQGEEVPAPMCVQGAFSRANHLGNVGGSSGQPFYFNWTIPAYLKGKERCVLRVRYNMSSSDFDSLAVDGDSTLNGAKSPLVDRNKNPADSYKEMQGGLCSGGSCKLGMHVNTNQYGRTFQDRSFTFRVKEVPEGASCDKIYNLNVRGKRGNIVQTYPAVEYDFVPNTLQATAADCIHLQWTGSDWNPNRNGNNGAGGPPNPVNTGDTKADRMNMVQTFETRNNMMRQNANEFSMFGDLQDNKDVYRRLAFLDQRIEDGDKCFSYEQLATANDDDVAAIDRDHRNCMKLNAALTPYFDAGLLNPSKGVHTYMSTRNNNFSNRGAKGVLVVSRAPLSIGAIVGISLAVAAALSGLAYAVCVVVPRRKRAKRAATSNSKAATAAAYAVGAPGGAVVRPLSGQSQPKAVALYDRKADEDGELSFKTGDEIYITLQDASGWWQGRHATNNNIGLLPSSWVKLVDPVAATAV